MASFFGMKSAVIQRSDKENMTEGRWKGDGGSESKYHINARIPQ